MSLEVTGKLLVKFETQQVSEKFKKREFVIELAEEINGNIYTNFAKMQLVQNKCEILDRYNEGDQIKVSFNIKGNKWERDGKVNYITNLDAWRIESASAAAGNSGAQNSAPSYNNAGGNNSGANNNFNSTANFNPSPETVDDLPF
jgi:single-stranded DNA-binding protein